MKLPIGDIEINVVDSGAPQGAPVVFAHALGLDLSVWDAVVALMPPQLRLIRFDLRGHGQSEVPPAPYTMGALVRDAEALLDTLEVRDAVFVGNSIGGMIAQGLAVKRLDQIRALVLSNTAAKIGQPALWAERIAQVQRSGTGAIAAAALDKWFSPAARKTEAAQACARRVAETAAEGYTGCCAAISGTDFYTPTSGLRLPVLAIAGGHDGSTPPDLVRETQLLVPGSQFALIHRAGHLPMIDQPEAFAQRLTDFLHDIGHL
ncbi:3-oxoadipate enol-lactonase 2 [Aquimixticola soesokkakensis]|uniref:3-oxoadipate enol-lactonase 2 n=1 Tax=Aquimixticola soesokkakensis TaxID=1519096 RepID=A0A1Y5TDT5_9RHOB|nr:3-oxoadipate enol-lactonase [Aquimixticola soesokkakensis]SLN59712.1 3-oxoadipate enol-lactonase 2 [Aquimixticola soesokkakensis]